RSRTDVLLPEQKGVAGAVGDGLKGHLALEAGDAGTQRVAGAGVEKRRPTPRRAGGGDARRPRDPQGAVVVAVAGHADIIARHPDPLRQVGTVAGGAGVVAGVRARLAAGRAVVGLDELGARVVRINTVGVRR